MKRSTCIIFISILCAAFLPVHASALPTFASPFKVYIPIVITPRATFFAWAQTWDGRIPVQLMTLDARQERQYTCDAQSAAQFASAHPGHLYIACDEPDIHLDAWGTPSDYAVYYHNFVVHVSAADPTAKFSPAGFALTSPGLHYVEYAQAFHDAYSALYGSPPPVAEWRFHAFICTPDNLAYWKQKVTEAAEWSVNHGAQMTLGSFGMPCATPDPDITDAMWEMYYHIKATPDIVSAVWWSSDWHEWPHTLTNPDGSLSPEGQIYIQWR